MRSLLVLIASSLLLTLSYAADNTRGIWRGTVARQEVMVCLGDDDNDANYYYLRFLKGIPLTRDGAAAHRWLEKADVDEAKVTGIWELDNVQAEQMSGKWTDANGKKSAPIALTRLAPHTGEHCDSPAFNAPRIAAQKRVEGKVQQLNGLRYQTVSVMGGKVKGLVLLDGGANMATVNAALRAEQDKHVVAAYDCDLMATGSPMGKGEYLVTPKPVFWNDHWLAISITTDTDCGGAHPNEDISYQNWDMSSGTLLDPWTWFEQIGANHFYANVPDSLAKVISAAYSDDGECRGVIDENRTYTVRLAKNGLVFMPVLPHVAGPCATEITLPFAKLQRFLNAKGKAEVAQLGKH